MLAEDLLLAASFLRIFCKLGSSRTADRRSPGIANRLLLAL
jgi:hypothetical protein